MELVNPGFWQIITLGGIFLSFIGSSLLALTSMNWYQEQMERRVRKDFGYAATFGVELIEDGSTLTRGDRGYDQLTWYLTEPGIAHRLDLPIDSEDTIEEITKTKSTEWGDYVSIVDGDGVLHENVTTTAAIREKIEEEVDRRLEEIQDRATRYSWETLAFGFLIQFVSHFARHFIVI